MAAADPVATATGARLECTIGTVGVQTGEPLEPVGSSVPYSAGWVVVVGAAATAVVATITSTSGCVIHRPVAILAATRRVATVQRRVWEPKSARA